MKPLILGVLFLVGAWLTPLRGQPMHEPVPSLSPEEMRLIWAFRANPEPFRHLMRERPSPGPVMAGRPFIGPRDVIDVTVSDGKIVFWGKRGNYRPASIRLFRGEVAFMVFQEERGRGETRVRVSYLADGLHFDIPDELYPNATLQRGFIVIPETPAWRMGDPTPWGGTLDSHHSHSEAQGVTFRIRYASQ